MCERIPFLVSVCTTKPRTQNLSGYSRIWRVDRVRGLSCACFEHLSRGHPPVRAEGRGDARDALRHVSARERGGHHRHRVDSGSASTQIGVGRDRRTGRTECGHGRITRCCGDVDDACFRGAVLGSATRDPGPLTRRGRVTAATCACSRPCCRSCSSASARDACARRVCTRCAHTFMTP